MGDAEGVSLWVFYLKSKRAKFALTSFQEDMITRTLPNTDNSSNTPPNRAKNALIFAKTTEPYFYPKHKTPFLLATQWQGKGTYRLNEQPIQISNRDFYFINANDELEIRFEEKRPIETLLILFEERFVKESLASLIKPDKLLLDQPHLNRSESMTIPPVPFELTDDIKRMLMRIVNEDQTADQLDLLLFDLITQFEKVNRKAIGQLQKIPVTKSTTKMELFKRLHMAKEFMNDHVCYQIGLDEIAKESGMNKFHLLSHFRKRYGSTPYQYLLEQKLQRAKSMLIRRKHSVTEVCHAVGFDSLGSFSNAYTKRFKIRPSELLK